MDKKDFYEDIGVAEVSDEQKRRAKIMASLAKGRDIKTMIDIGCNPKMAKIILDETHCRGVGVNISRRIADSAKIEGLKMIVADAEKLDTEEKFDLAVCGEVLEHITDVDSFIKKISSMLNENGYLLLSVPNLASLFNRISLLFGWQPRGINPSRKISFNPVAKYDYNWGHVSMFTLSAIKKFLRENGFEILKVKGAYGGHDGESRVRSVIRKFMSIKPSFAECIIILARKY